MIPQWFQKIMSLFPAKRKSLFLLLCCERSQCMWCLKMNVLESERSRFIAGFYQLNISVTWAFCLLSKFQFHISEMCNDHVYSQAVGQ